MAYNKIYIRAMLFTICKLRALKHYGGDFFFSWELLKECLQQCLIPEILRKFQRAGGEKKNHPFEMPKYLMDK